jgi:hypothetical protein
MKVPLDVAVHTAASEVYIGIRLKVYTKYTFFFIQKITIPSGRCHHLRLKRTSEENALVIPGALVKRRQERAETLSHLLTIISDIGNIVTEHIWPSSSPSISSKSEAAVPCGKTLAILHLLDVAEAGRHAPVAGCRKSVEVDGHVAVVARAAFHRIKDQLHLAVNDLRASSGRVQEHVACVVLIIRTVDVAVTERELQIGRDLAAPLLTLRILLGASTALWILARVALSSFGSEGDGILLISAVDALRFPDVSEANAAGNDHFGRGCSLICHSLFYLHKK